MKRFDYEPASAVKEYVKGVEFTHYAAEKLLIDSMDSRLDDDERKTRFYIMDRIIENAMPFSFASISEDMQKALNLTEDMIKDAIKRLVEKGAAVSDEEQNINFIYPVSGFPTNHQIELADGRKFSAMCAVDGMGCAFTFRQNIKLRSACSKCGEAVYVEIRDGEIVSLSPKEAHVLHVDLNGSQNWSGSCWNIMNFFCTKEHYDEWTKEAGVPEEQIFCLKAEEAIWVSRMLFGLEKER